jgi:two-component sensor histidine kinase
VSIIDLLNDFIPWFPAFGLLIIGVLILISRVYRKNPFSIGLLMCALAWVWFRAGADNLPIGNGKWAVYYCEYISLAFIPPFWIGTCLSFAGRTVARFRWLLISLFSAAALFTVFLLSNSSTYIFFQSITISAKTLHFSRNPGIIYIVFMIYLFASLVSGIIYIIGNRSDLSIIDRKRSFFILIAVAAPVLAGIVDVFREFSGQGISFASVAIIFSVVVLIIGMFRSRLLSPVPLAHKAMIDEMLEPVFVLDDRYRIVYANPSGHLLSPDGYLPPRIAFNIAFPEIVWRNGKESLVRIRNRDYILRSKPILVKKEAAGATVILFHDVTMIAEENFRLEALVLERNKLLHDTNKQLQEEITRYQKAQTQLEELVQQKEILLREVHHRVKNNLQIIMSMMSLQNNRLGDNDEIREICNAMKNRIRSISLVHELLYQAAFFEGLDFGSYIAELVKGIGGFYSDEGVQTVTEIKTDKVKVSTDFCINLGLVLNELVINAIKHGVLPVGRGKVTVSLRKESDMLIMAVSDTGRGFPGDYPSGNGKSLGMSIINSIITSYKATLKFYNRNGTIAEIAIPLDAPGLSA